MKHFEWDHEGDQWDREQELYGKPSQKHNQEQNQEQNREQDREQDLERHRERHKNVRKILLAVIFLVLLCCCFVLLYQLRGYEDYDTKTSVERDDSSYTEFLEFQGNLLKYSRDGAFYTDYSGKLIWNYTYEMKSPEAKTCESFVMIYDKGGTELAVLSPTGMKGGIQTSLPIVDADVAAQGTVAVLMQQGTTAYIELYDVDGRLLASGELHGSNSGYPVSLALSSSGEKLMVSMFDLREGDIKSTITFYHFGKAGQDAIDNVVASYSYSNMIIPEVDFVKGDRAIAFGDSEIVLYKNDTKSTCDKEIFLQGTIKSVFHNEEYFGIVCDATLEDGSQSNEMTVYSVGGYKKFSKQLDISYRDIEIMSNNEIVLSDGADVNIYTSLGIKKFAYEFETGIYKIIPGDGSKNYIFLMDGTTEKVRLR